MTSYQKFRRWNPDLSDLGFERPGEGEPYFCTPKGARIIGRAGVDGIHYCFVRGYGETVFSVNPSCSAGQNVCPIAATFEDLLRLLLAVGDMAALDQAWWWDREQFDDFLKENPIREDQQPILAAVRDRFGLTPMPDPYGYLRQLRRSVDLGRLTFSEEYYEALEAAREEPPEEWKVTLEGGFFPVEGRSGREVPLNRTFSWCGWTWQVPTLYLCSDGVVLDFLIQVDREEYRRFLDRARPLMEQTEPLTQEQQLFLQQNNPFSFSFQGKLELNGTPLRQKHSLGEGWIPLEFLEEGTREDLRSRWVLEHYGLDLSTPCMIRRVAFPLEGARKLDVHSLKLRLQCDPVDVPAGKFPTPPPGEPVAISHPRTGQVYTLRVQEVHPETIDPGQGGNPEVEYPTHMTVMTYTLEPELPKSAYAIRDCDRGDSPRPRNSTGGGSGEAVCHVVGVLLKQSGSGERVISSSLHFVPQEELPVWRFVFREKPGEDLEISLLGEA